MKRFGPLLAIALGGLVLVGVAVAAASAWSTKLTGESEVPPRETKAHGQAHFWLSNDETSVSYIVSAAQLTNVFQGHIHCGAAGVNGPVIVWLYPSTAPVAGPTGQGRVDGVLARGTFTDANVIDRPQGPPPTGCPIAVDDLADVVSLINSGLAYVNLHTSDGVDPANTGPGDFPGGEIRGQLP